MFPIVLDVRERLVLVVGGGPVGLRKANRVYQAGGRVRLVCREPANDPRFEWLCEDYQPSHLTGVSLVFAAADSVTNSRVCSDARAAGLWVNHASEPDQGDFHLPALLQRGEFTIAVSTGGAGPALAQRVRDALEPSFGPELADWVRLLAEMRQLARQWPDESRRRQWLADLTSESWRERLITDGVSAVREAMLRGLSLAQAEGSV